MYTIICDGRLIHDDRLDDRKVLNGTYEGELGKAGTLSFDILPTNPMYGEIRKLKSNIELWRGDSLIWFGRVLDDSTGMHKTKKIQCEGALAYLCDSVQKPYEYTGDLAGFITRLLARHNECVAADRQISEGNITVTDEYINRHSADYRITKDIVDDLVKSYGGYIAIRKTDTGMAFDWLADYPTTETQTVELGKNLTDIMISVSGTDTYTVMIPLGAKIQDEDGNETDSRVTIESVNEGSDSIEDAEAVAAYGRIYRTVIWDDVTVPANLKTKAVAEMAKGKALKETVELKAVDMSAAGYQVPAFRIGQYIRAISTAHGIEKTYLVRKQKLSLGSPGADSLTLGETRLTYTQQAQATAKENAGKITEVESSVERQEVTIRELSRQLASSIQQAIDSVLISVSESYYAKGSDELVALIESKLAVTAEGIEARLTSVQTDLENDLSGTNDRISYISNYLRYVVGDDGIGVVELGVDGNPIVLRQRYNRIYFSANGLDVMYIEVDPNNFKSRLYITEAEILGAIIIGGVAMQRSPSGGIAIVKAGDYNG